MECGKGETGTVDWELGKEMVAAESERVSEGKRMASDRCGGGLRQGWCRDARKATLGFRQKGERGRAKMMVFLALNRATSRRSDATSRRSRGESSNDAMLGSNVMTFQRVITTNVATLESHVATFQRV